MTKRTKSNIPFVGLHAHSVTGSPFDGFGYPSEHMDFSWQNGCDAMALTEHGNMNSLSWQYLHGKEMNVAGKSFKPIYGIEAYFNPSIEEWRQVHEDFKKTNKDKEETSAATIIADEGDARKEMKSRLKQRHHIILLAQNQKGLNNIFQMVSKSFQGDYYYRFPRIDYALLKEHNEGVIATSACLGGCAASCYWNHREQGDAAVKTALRELNSNFIDIFGKRWFAEVQWNRIPEQHALNKLVIEVAQEMDIELISTADSHYPDPQAWLDREIYKRLGWIGKKKPDWLSDVLPKSLEDIEYELFPKNGDQMYQAYKKYSQQLGVSYDDKLILESIERTHDIAFNRIENFVLDTSVKLPNFVVPENSTAEDALSILAWNGLKAKGLLEDTTYSNRLLRELEVIKERGFSKYFLTMKAIADEAKTMQLVGVGRGSAAGSLLAYTTGITNVDPIKYKLQFERFILLESKDMPDIDFDCSDRDALRDHLTELWGEDTVVPISNWNKLQLKSLIKDVSKFYDIPFTEVNNVTLKMIKEATPRAKDKHGIKAGVYVPTYEEVMEFSDSLQNFIKKYPKVGTHIEALVGQIKNCGRHAGGLIIADDISKHMPLINNQGVMQTPWSEGQNVKHLEPLGFIKFDVLGVSTLQMIETAIRHILKRHEGIIEPNFEDVKNWYNNHLDPSVINFDDQNIWKNIFHEGKWAGIFQFTKTGAQNFCKRAKPNSIVELSAITSIYRPGPLSANVDNGFINAKQGETWVEYIHPLHKEVTEETYGYIIFQEQIAALVHKLGKNITLDNGNKLRKLFTRKDLDNSFVKDIYNKFLIGCDEKNIPTSKAEDLWEQMINFVQYGFNLSHAIAYSMLSFQCAYMLYHYPIEWTAAFLERADAEEKEEAVNIAQSLGFKLSGIDINNSGHVWEILGNNTLVQSLSTIKGIGDAAIEQILQHRPFTSIEHFLFHKDMIYSKVNKKCLDVLVRSGALDTLMDSRFNGRKHFWSCVAVDRANSKKKFIENIDKYRTEGSFSKVEEIENIVDLTGVFPFDMVMTKEINKNLQYNNIPPLGEFDANLGVAWFVPRKVVAKKTKNNKMFWIIEAIDTTNKTTKVRCWGVDPRHNEIYINRPYMARLDYNHQWGFSIRKLDKQLKLLG